ncbi:sulfite exporter TauE/SafE family protein [Macrococcus equipercicus]|uniref:Probable membrane transporter protein n=1 Tax=Macrococcus equipercicus TaxID=69967 RepID=A0A9Q9F3P2_9STAP|nr:sulfite exporter TauE/SafE family protein [Macrococcus equipercicus]KAA1042523.1 sulfite exporter TauE/SafE family protein [Macrococcus equipercicus]UTH14384.1 sulfite exporter TauE/SafE family protein [Macrococcus equipercicus]
MSIVILIILGVLSAVIGAIVGIGGGIIIVPTLIYLGMDAGILDDITPQKAIGTSTVILISTGLSATLGYLKTKQVDLKSGMLFLCGIVPGAFIGAYLSRYLTLDSFNLYFGIFLIIISIVLMVRNHIKPIKLFQNEAHQRMFTDAAGTTHHYSIAPVPAIIATFIVGCLTGLFGIGGGALMTPLMIILFRFPPHIAVGTSMLMIFFSSLSGAVSHIVQGNVIWYYAVILIIASYIGANIGVQINKRMKSDTVILVLRSIMLLLGVYLIIKSLL